MSNKNSTIEKQTTTGNLNHTYKIKVPYETFQNWAQEYRAKKTIHGFRPGKAPISMFKEDWARSCASACAQDLIKENDFKQVFSSTFRTEQFEADKEVLINLFIELYPQVPEIDCSKIELKRYRAEIGKKDVEKTIENWKKNNFKASEKSDENKEITLNDFVVLSGEIVNPFGGKEKIPTTQVQVGKNKLLPEIEVKLIGKKMGESIEHEVLISKDNSMMKKANLKEDAKAMFTFKIDSVNAPVIYETKDMFSVFKVSSEAELTNHFKHSLESENEEFAKKILKEKMKYELGKFFFEIPISLWQKRIGQVEHQMLEQIGFKKGDDLAKTVKEKLQMEMEDFRKRVIGIAESSARITFLIDHFARIYAITATADEVNKEIEKQGENFPGGKQAAVQLFKENTEAKDNISKRILEDKVLENMIKKSQITDKNVTLDELFSMNILEEESKEDDKKIAANKSESAPKKKATSKKSLEEESNKSESTPKKKDEKPKAKKAAPKKKTEGK